MLLRLLESDQPSSSTPQKLNRSIRSSSRHLHDFVYHFIYKRTSTASDKGKRERKKKLANNCFPWARIISPYFFFRFLLFPSLKKLLGWLTFWHVFWQMIKIKQTKFYDDQATGEQILHKRDTLHFNPSLCQIISVLYCTTIKKL